MAYQLIYDLFSPSSEVSAEARLRPRLAQPPEGDSCRSRSPRPAEQLRAARPQHQRPLPGTAAAVDGAAALLAAVQFDDDEDDQDDVLVFVATEGGAHGRRPQRAHAVSIGALLYLCTENQIL